MKHPKCLVLAVLLSLLLNCACTESNSSNLEESNSSRVFSEKDSGFIPKHKDLLWSQVELACDMKSGDINHFFTLTRMNFTNKTQFENYLLVTSYFRKSACPIYKGTIRMNNDTIILDVEPKTSIDCEEEAFFKATYVINNASNKAFHILKKSIPD